MSRSREPRAKLGLARNRKSGAYFRPAKLPTRRDRDLKRAAPFSGRALITLQKDRILEKHIIELSPTGTGQILLETLPSFAPNVWATAHVIRKISLEPLTGNLTVH